MRFISWAARRAAVGAGVAIVALLPWETANAGLSGPDTLVTGHVAAAVAGRHVGVSVGGKACMAVSGGTTDANGAFQVVVANCGPGTATLTLDGSATSTTFAIKGGEWVNLDKATGSPTPAPKRPVSAAPVKAPARPSTPIPHAPRPAAIPAAKPAAPQAGAPSGPPVPDSLVMGTIPGATDGQSVTAKLGDRACTTVAGGKTGSSGVFAVVIGNCGPGTATLLLDGASTGITFATHPGAVVNINPGPAAIASPSATPSPAATATPGSK